VRAGVVRLLAMVAVAVSAFACGGPDPDEIELLTKAAPDTGVDTPLRDETTVTVGDLVGVEARARDGDDVMKLCIEVSSSAPDVVVARRASGACDEPRLFGLGAKKPGTARVRFAARGTSREVTIVVRD
jgi:hypothetical protein